MPRLPFLRRALKRLRAAIAPVPVILMYHRIAEESFDPWGLAVPEDRFREQLGWLRMKRRPFALNEFVERHRAGNLPRNAVALTFDDGYACNSSRAAPLLAAFEVPATMFVTTGPVLAAREFWWDELERLALALEDERLGLDLPTGRLELRLGSRQAQDRHWPPFANPATPRQAAYHQIWAALREIEPDEQQCVLADMRRSAGLPDEARDTHRPMRPEEVAALPAQGIDVGAHSLSHSSLPGLSTARKQDEIEGSRSQCAAMTGTTPRSFAYPYGDFDEECMRLVRAAGFDCACTTVETGVGRAEGLHRLPRLRVGNWGVQELERVLGGI